MIDTVPASLLPEALVWLAKSAVIVLLAGLLGMLLRKRPASVRHTVWKAAFLAIMFLPFMDALLPDYIGSGRDIPVHSVPATGRMQEELFRSAPVAMPAPIPPPMVVVPPPVTSEAARGPFPWLRVAAVLWLGVSAMLLLRLLASAWALRRRGSASESPSDEMRAEFCKACRIMGVRPGRVRLVIASAGHTPMTWGFFKPVVLLPESASTDDPPLLRSVLLHELAHVRRADFLWDTLARVIVALQWPSPFAWFAAAALDRERERACDAAVVSAGICPRAYARHLLSVVAYVKPARLPAMGTAMARSTQVEGRLRAILVPPARKASPVLGVVLATAVLGGGGLVAVCGDETSSRSDSGTIAAPGALETVVLNGTPYVPLDALASRYGLENLPGEANDSFLLRLSGGDFEITGERDAFELRVGGVRVLLDDPVLESDGLLHLSERTVMGILDPVLRPGELALGAIDTVIIDAGHGGSDSGGVVLGIKEKDLTLAMARELQEELKALPVKTVLTRSDDRALSLGERAALARQYPRAVILSLHANSHPDPGRNGIETYIGARRSAPATVLALAVHAALLRDTGSVDGGVAARDFSLLRQDLPAIVIETGYLTNKSERERLVHGHGGFRKDLARALVEGIRLYSGLAGTRETEDESESAEDSGLWTKFKSKAFPEIPACDWREIPLADSFEFPVGGPDGEGFYLARGFKENEHFGGDFNGKSDGKGGGNSDYGMPVRSIGTGRVIFARDVGKGWGNVVIIRHQYLAPDTGTATPVDSLYGHLAEIHVEEGQTVNRRDLIGTIGTNKGMYVAHLHLEIRKNLAIGLNRSKFARDLTNYHDPLSFLHAHAPEILRDEPAKRAEDIRKVSATAKAPADFFLAAYLMCQHAERLAEEGDTEIAVVRMEEARKRLNHLSERWPDWMVNVVAYRRGEIHKTLERWRAGDE